MPKSNRRVLTVLLLMACIFASGRLGWFYYDGYRAQKEKAAEEADRRRRDESLVRGLLQKQDAAAPTRDGQHPCVSVSSTDSSVKPELGTCATPSDLSVVVDRFEVDLRYGNFLMRQTDLSLSDILDAPLVRTYNSGDYITQTVHTRLATTPAIRLTLPLWGIAIPMPMRCWYSRTATISFSTGYQRERATQMG